MKKTVLALLIFLMLALSACGGNSPANDGLDEPPATKVAKPVKQNTVTPTATQAGFGTVSLDTSYENAVSVELQLLLGTLKLKGTDLAITQTQASVLLPLWKNLKTLSQSTMPAQGGSPQGPSNATPQPQSTSTATQKQIDALAQQIAAAMTQEQITAIAGMKITQQTAMTIMQEQGLTMGSPPQGNGSGTGNGNQPSGAPPSGGQQPQGTPPAGGPGNSGSAGGPPDGQQPPQGPPPAGGPGNSGGTGAPSGGQQPQGTPPAGGPGNSGSASGQQQSGNAQMSAPPMGGGMFPPGLIDAVIQLLEQVATGQSTTTSTQTTSAAYVQSGGTATKTNQTYTASSTDQSGVYVSNAGKLTLTNSTITTSGNTSSQDKSSFYGLNAAVLAASAGTINLSNSSVTTTGTGANGVFATGAGSSVVLSKVTIKASADGAHGVMATQGGSLTLTDVDMSTAGTSSGAIATDRGGGTINATGGTVTTSGQNSPGIYSTGDIAVTGATITASGAEAAVIEGANSITLKDTTLSSSKDGKWGVMIYQSMSGDAEGARGIFTMTGGALAYTASNGPLFYVTNSTGVITLKGVNVMAASGTLVKASTGNWGNAGSNGGTAILTADGQTLTGNLVADNLSSLTVKLQNGSSLTGSINSDRKAKAVNLTLDSSSTWNVTADSYLTCLTDSNGISGTTVSNIIGNGHTVYYYKSACTALGGQTYALNGGGALEPAD